MAGDWIKWTVGLTTKREILELASRLLIAPAHAAGCLMVAMEFVDQNVTDFDEAGHGHVTIKIAHPDILDSIVGVSGFTEAMVEVGWIRHEGDVLTFVNAGRHNGKSAKSRALNTANQRHRRSMDGVTKMSRSKSDTSSLLFSYDSDLMQSLRSNPAYAGIDIDREHGKAEAWCAVNHRICSRKFFVNWLNKVDRPMGYTGQRRTEIPLEPVNWRERLSAKFPDWELLKDERDWQHLPPFQRDEVVKAITKLENSP